MTKSEIEAHIHQVYDARLKNDASVYLPKFAHDAIVQISGDIGASEIAFKTDSAADLAGVMQKLTDTWKWMSVDFKSVIVDGQSAAVRYQLRTLYVPTNTEIDTHVMDQLVFNEDGKLTEFYEFVDTAFVERLTTKTACKD